MFLTDAATLVLSASDLTRASECEFAVARGLDARLGRIEKPDPATDALLDRVAQLGNAHEADVLAEYVEQFGRWDPASPDAGGVAMLEMAGGRDVASMERAAARTREVLASGADVIYQACFFDGSFLGYADFIVRDPDSPRTWLVQDTKLARRAKVQALIQLGAYADQLETAGFIPSSRVELILGTRERSSHRTDELVAVYRARMGRLRALLAPRMSADTPVAWESGAVRACLRCEVCEPFVEATNDVILVAGLSIHQREKLAEVGIHTVPDLADSTGVVGGIGTSTLAGLRAQASLQHRQATGGEVLAEVADPAPILALPTPSYGDIFFDFEGDPLWYDETTTDQRDAWGLEYLFGVVESPLDGADPVFRPFWAHDRAEEKAALIAFLDYVERRRETYPDLHIYHYAPYERSALLRLAGRYGVGEDIIDDWLRHGVLVDLYATVRAGVRIGQESYSLKKLEPLFMGAREDDVTTAGDSIVAYAEAVDARDAGDTAEWQRRIQDIADYNETDCLATLNLRDWLLGLVGWQSRAATGDATEGMLEEGDGRAIDERADRLAALAGEPPRDPDAQAVAMLAAAVGYHWREAKPFWWAHFDRLASDPSEWMDRRACLAADEVSVVDDWHLPPRARNWKRRVRMVGRLEPGSEIRGGAAAVSIYEPELPDRAKVSATGMRGWVDNTRIESAHSAGELDEVIALESGPPKADEPHAQLPMGLGPTSGPGTGTIEERIAGLADTVLSSPPGQLPAGPALDLLRRVPPRTRSGAALPPWSAGTPAHDTITDALLDIDDTYLAVQGPPGTGKTYNGARVVKALVERGWKVGVVAQSHAVVENFLDGAIAAGVSPSQIAKKAKAGTDQSDVDWSALSDTWLAGRDGGFLTGGTKWTYTSDKNIPEGGYDLIVVDEAGQFSLADTIAVAGAAKRILLLGDPQQLPQVSQGTHPEPVDASALGWLSDGHDTLSAEFGYFLGTTYRMHPAVCEVVSTMSYDGELHAHPSTSERALEGVAPGVIGVEVEHHGNSVLAPEEVAEVVAQVHDLLGRTWDDGTHSPRPLGIEDVLVVAAYNAQVHAVREALEQAGFDDPRVGTVDKLQGQQAPVVLVSLAASSADEISRGMEFLLSRNRMNVAISRAQWCTRIIHSPDLADYLPTRPEQLSELGSFLLSTGAGTA